MFFLDLCPCMFEVGLNGSNTKLTLLDHNVSELTR